MEQEKKECQPWPGDAMTLRDGSGAYGGRLGCGDTHRCVSERSPLRAFLEMEPILLSSMKLWGEGGVRERPPSAGETGPRKPPEGLLSPPSPRMTTRKPFFTRLLSQ